MNVNGIGKCESRRDGPKEEFEALVDLLKKRFVSSHLGLQE